ncbi:uncharacterized protein LOC110455972 isoform X2 [Mizuhopecten yessoensis]|uniref:uncharacterized protein LOC110455972 isoform X2 n=1 Tax=Mizuhopecten yessoensis TaxID=6573 RepID=UPI000B45998A|nr:uncharacterized protein LOC110455972 isoform X2 [Mizuhopecten yessoensis]
MKMRPSGEQVQESTFCDILHNAVLQVCREKYWADSPDWEVDGVICISVPHSQEQHVVKIHQKFPSNSSKHFDDRCYECDRKSKDVPLPANEETTKRHFSESVEEDDSSYRNVSVIDLEHASTQPNPARTCGQGTIPQSLPSPEREHDQNSHNFYASPDLSGFGPNVHRQKDEHLKNSGGQSHSKSNNRTKDQEHSSSFTSHPRETTPPRKKTKTKPEEYVVVKAEPDDDEDFALHMECIDEKESDNIVEIKDENNQRDLAAETQEDINFLLNVEGASASHQYNSGDRSWSQRLPTSTVTSQMDTNLSPMSGQGSQGFSNLNLLTHGVDIEDGTMRLTTRVQHPSFIPGQTDSNTPEQRTIPRPSGQDPASNTIGTQKRFAETTNEETACKRLKIPKADNTLKANRKASVVFRDYLREKELETDFEQQSVDQLCKQLGHFYMDARKHDGTHYKTSSLEQFRYSLNRYLRSPPFNKQYDIIKDCEFSEANVNFKAVMCELKRMGKGETEHYPVITKADRHKLYSSQHLDVNTPVGLYNKVQFDIRLYFCKRGTDNMHKMTKSTFEIVTDLDTGLKYVRKADEVFKNLHSNDKDVWSGNMPESPGSPFCPVASYESYISKLNPQCERLWQRPNRESPTHNIWYYNSPVGEKKLAVFMSELSKACSLSFVYTNYSIRATGNAILSKNMFDAAQIMAVTGHNSVHPVAVYQKGLLGKSRLGQFPSDNVVPLCIKLELDEA